MHKNFHLSERKKFDTAPRRDLNTPDDYHQETGPLLEGVKEPSARRVGVIADNCTDVRTSVTLREMSGRPVVVNLGVLLICSSAESGRVAILIVRQSRVRLPARQDVAQFLSTYKPRISLVFKQNISCYAAERTVLNCCRRQTSTVKARDEINSENAADSGWGICRLLAHDESNMAVYLCTRSQTEHNTTRYYSITPATGMFLYFTRFTFGGGIMSG